MHIFSTSALYFKITTAFVDRATQNLSPEKSQNLRDRVHNLNIGLNYPWNVHQQPPVFLQQQGASYDFEAPRVAIRNMREHMRICAKQIGLLIVYTSIFLTIGIGAIVASQILTPLNSELIGLASHTFYFVLACGWWQKLCSEISPFWQLGIIPNIFLDILDASRSLKFVLASGLLVSTASESVRVAKVLARIYVESGLGIAALMGLLMTPLIMIATKLALSALNSYDSYAYRLLWRDPQTGRRDQRISGLDRKFDHLTEHLLAPIMLKILGVKLPEEA